MHARNYSARETFVRLPRGRSSILDLVDDLLRSIESDIVWHGGQPLWETVKIETEDIVVEDKTFADMDRAPYVYNSITVRLDGAFPGEDEDG